jgi:hypothetical protein
MDPSQFGRVPLDDWAQDQARLIIGGGRARDSAGVVGSVVGRRRDHPWIVAWLAGAEREDSPLPRRCLTARLVMESDALARLPHSPQNRVVRRIGSLIGAILVLVGMFWAGRESGHGFGALWEHWWCPIPIVAILVGLATVWLLARHPTQTA